MKNITFIAADNALKAAPAILSLALGLSMGALQAQPPRDGGGPGGGQRFGGRPGEGLGGPQGGRRGGPQDDFDAWPAEEMGRPAEQKQQESARHLRQSLREIEVTDEAVQDAVIAFAADADNARIALQEKVRELAGTLRDPNSTTAHVSAQLADLRGAAQAERLRRASAESQLNDRIRFRNNSRLDAFLSTSGLIGDAALLGGPGSPAGRGGRRGGPGGGNDFSGPRGPGRPDHHGGPRGHDGHEGRGGHGGPGGREGRGGRGGRNDFGGPGGADNRGGFDGPGGRGGPAGTGGRGGPRGRDERDSPGGRGGRGRPGEMKFEGDDRLGPRREAEEFGVSLDLDL